MRIGALILTASFLWACSPDDGGGTDITPTDTGGGDNDGGDNDTSNVDPPGDYTKLTFSVSDVEVFTGGLAAGIQGKLVRGNDGTLFYAYLKYDGALNDPEKDCDIAVFAGGPATNSTYSLRVSVKPPNGAWTSSEVPLQNVGAEDNVAAVGGRLGLDGTLDGSGNLVLAFAAGGPGLFTCASSDLVLATRGSGGTWSFSVPTDDSSACCDVPDCEDAACVQGSDVGMWAAVAKRPNNSLGVAFTDAHFVTDDDGQTFQGFELWESGGVSGISPWSGRGNYASLAYLADGTALTTYSGYKTGGVFFARRTGTAGSVEDWEKRDLYNNAKVGERISLKIAPNGTTVGVAFFARLAGTGSALDDLVYCESADSGANWKGPTIPDAAAVKPACEVVESLGNVGQNPSLAFDKNNQPAISYYYCGTSGDCAASGDGLRFAWYDREAHQWRKWNVHFDGTTKSGLYSQLVMDPETDVPTIAFHDATRGAAMVAQGTLEGGTEE